MTIDVFLVQLTRLASWRGDWRCVWLEAGGEPFIMNPQPSTLNPQPSTLNPQPWTLNSEPCTLHPELWTLNSQAVASGGLREFCQAKIADKAQVPYLISFMQLRCWVSSQYIPKFDCFRWITDLIWTIKLKPFWPWSSFHEFFNCPSKEQAV